MFSGFIGSALLGMAVCFIAGAGLVFTQKWHGWMSYDSRTGVQRVHVGAVPRVGGVALVLAYFSVWLTMEGPQAMLFGLIGLAGLPVVFAGLLEDLTKSIGVKARLAAAVLSGMIFVIGTGYAIERVELGSVDALLALPLVALVFSGFAIGGMASAVNFIDGFNGLAAGTTLITVLAFTLVAARSGDVELARIGLALAAIVAGFFVLNFPFGKLFLGDAGAFFLGYLLATLGVMLPARNPEVSPWVSVVILGYPVVESLFTVVRRLGKGPGQWKASEATHLHHLVHRGWAQATRLKPPVLQNALTSVFIWALPLSSMIFVSLGPVSRTSALWYLVVLLVIYALWYWRLAVVAAARPVAL